MFLIVLFSILLFFKEVPYPFLGHVGRATIEGKREIIVTEEEEKHMQ